MSSPFWQCPICHKLSRKDEQLAELAEVGINMGITGMGNCPNCGRPIDLQVLYVEAKYDVALEDVYSGKYGMHLVENIRRLYGDGKINLSEEEKNLLFKGRK